MNVQLNWEYSIIIHINSRFVVHRWICYTFNFLFDDFTAPVMTSKIPVVKSKKFRNSWSSINLDQVFSIHILIKNISLVSSGMTSYEMIFFISLEKQNTVHKARSPSIDVELKLHIDSYIPIWLNAYVPSFWKIKSSKEIRVRIEKARIIFKRMNQVFSSRDLGLHQKISLMRCYVLSVVYYGIESWALRKKVWGSCRLLSCGYIAGFKNFHRFKQLQMSRYKISRAVSRVLIISVNAGLQLRSSIGVKIHI